MLAQDHLLGLSSNAFDSEFPFVPNPVRDGWLFVDTCVAELGLGMNAQHEALSDEDLMSMALVESLRERGSASRDTPP